VVASWWLKATLRYSCNAEDNLKNGRPERGIDPSAHGARSHVRTGIVLAMIQVLGLVLSVGQDVLSAKLFGARVEMDVYLEAWIVPVVLANILGPSLQNALVPHFAWARTHRGDEAAWELAAEALLAGFGIFALAAVIGFAASSEIIGFVAVGAPPEKLPLLREIYAIGFIFSGLSLAGSLLGGLCNAVGRFVAPALLTSLLTLSPIVALLIFGGSLGIRVLPLSLAVGSAAQAVMLFVVVWHLGLRFRVPRHGVASRLRPLAIDAATVALATVPIGFMSVAERHFGSRLSTGAVAQVTYATKLISAAMRVFASGLSVIGLPLLSAYLARGEKERFDRVFSFLFRLGSYAATVGMIGLMVAAEPLVHALLQRGRFTPTDTAIVAACAQRAAPYLFYGILFPVLNAALLSARRAWILPVSNLVGLAIYLGLANTLTRPGGSPVMLSLAYAVGYDAILIPTYVLLVRERLVPVRPVILAVLRSAVIALLVLTPTWLCVRGLMMLSTPLLPLLVIVGVVGLTASTVAVSIMDAEVRERVWEALQGRPAPARAQV
jgi:putative peptidoglycan lipid II flippase